jgi:hypothetical protein
MFAKQSLNLLFIRTGVLVMDAFTRNVPQDSSISLRTAAAALILHLDPCAAEFIEDAVGVIKPLVVGKIGAVEEEPQAGVGGFWSALEIKRAAEGVQAFGGALKLSLLARLERGIKDDDDTIDRRGGDGSGAEIGVDRLAGRNLHCGRMVHGWWGDVKPQQEAPGWVLKYPGVCSRHGGPHDLLES